MSTHQILILDDDDATIEVLFAHLDATGLPLQLIRAGDRASYLRALQHPCDLILLDCVLSDIDGMTALHLAKKHQPSVPVIMVSGVLTEDEIVGFLKSGATDYLLKNNLWRLAPVVKRALDDARVAREALATADSLQETRSRFERVAENIPGAVYHFMRNPDGCYALPYASPYFNSLVGMSPEEVRRDMGAVFSRVEPSCLPELLQSIEQSASTLQTWSHVFPLRDQADRVRWMHGRSTPRSLPDGTIVWDGVLLDITEEYQTRQALEESRVQLEQLLSTQTAALEESEDRFCSMADQSPALIWLADRSCKGTWFNRGWLDFTGRSLPESLGDGWLADIHPDDLQRASATCQAAFDRRELFEMEFRLRRADGGYGWIADTGVPRFSSHGEFLGYVGYCWDIDARKRAEQQMIAARDEAERANRAKSEFLSSMSHELRTPLNAILGFTQLLEADPLLNEGHRDDLIEIRRAGEHLLELVNDLLDLARIESGRVDINIEPVSISALVPECLRVLRPLIERKRLSLRGHDSLSRDLIVLADRSRLRQVITNLLSNAIKYNCDGGSIEVAIAFPAHGMTRVIVRDTGSGISREKQADLFGAFNRLGAERSGIEGVGIGLNIARTLIEKMGGRIGVDSEPGKGSAFWIELPSSGSAGPASPAVSSAVDASQPDAGLRKLTVLYIEDNAANTRFVEKVVSMVPGLRFLSAEDPLKGLSLARANRPGLILLDVNLPGMNGFDVLKQLRAVPATARIPVVGVSANAMADDIRRAEKAGFDAYLTKPVKVPELLAILNRYR